MEKQDRLPGITPSALRRGDSIAFVSPSLRLNDVFAAPLARAKQWLEQQGFPVVTVFDPETPPDFSAQVQQRCEEIHTAFRDPQIKAIMCTVGGSEANELIPHLDYDLIRANPKIFCGFSDITVLHCAIFAQTGLRTFYGPTAIVPLGSYPEPDTFTGTSLLRMITEEGRQPLGLVPTSAEWAPELDAFFFGDPAAEEPLKYIPNPGWRWLREGSAKGRLFGGCLHTLMHLPGTKYWPDLRGRILLLETSLGESLKNGVTLPALREEMADLRNLGVFDQIAGLIVGRPYGYHDETKSKEYDEIVLNQTRGSSFPILIDVDVGHSSPVLTVPLDHLVELDSGSNAFKLLEPSVV